MGKIKNIDSNFNEQLGRFSLSNADNISFDLGNPSKKLKMAGVEDMPIKLLGSKLAKKIRQHEFDAQELRGLTKAVRNPIAVFKNHKELGAFSILTNIETRDGNFLVALDIGKGVDGGNNVVSTIFGKRKDSVIRWINDGKMKYVDKEKALKYLYRTAPIAVVADSQELISAANIIRNFQNRNNPGYIFSSG